MKKILFVLIPMILVLLPVFSFVLTAHAQSEADVMLWGGLEGDVQATTGLGNTDPREMAARVVNIMLGFIGIIAVIIILLGGFKWMTAAGNEEKVDEAKKLIGSGVIGLIILLAAFALAQFILNALYGATGAIG
ncbi:MAG: hypothetical protein V1867_03440 [Candidatus Falkowbacteria bacterium]